MKLWTVSTRLIAFYQLASAAAFTFTFVQVALSDPQVLTLVVFGGLVLFNLFAGTELYRDKRRGYWCSLANSAAQIPQIDLPWFMYNYIGIGYFSLAATIDPSTTSYLFGLSAGFYPGTFSIWFGGFDQKSEIAFGLITSSFIVFLYKSLRQKINQSSSVRTVET
jgi:hypothetical protein